METINLDQCILCETQGHSSKGNQLKWKHEGYWYKADHMGYEGLSEVIISKLLRYSNITDYVDYKPSTIEYKQKTYNGCRSRDFMVDGEELVTVDHLFRQYTGRSLTSQLADIESIKERITFMVNSVREWTKVEDFGQYLAMTLEMDMFFLNEDRHTNNIALIYNPKTKEYKNSPHFDNGLALLADTASDFPLDKPIQDSLGLIQAKPFSLNFDDQADEAVKLYGRQVRFSFQMTDVLTELEKFRGKYDDRILKRVEEVFRNQMRKYRYMFSV